MKNRFFANLHHGVRHAAKGGREKSKNDLNQLDEQ